MSTSRHQLIQRHRELLRKRKEAHQIHFRVRVPPKQNPRKRITIPPSIVPIPEIRIVDVPSVSVENLPVTVDESLNTGSTAESSVMSTDIPVTVEDRSLNTLTTVDSFVMSTDIPVTVEDRSLNTVDSSHRPVTLVEGRYLFSCPHCDGTVEVEKNQVNCTIFRHGSYKTPGFPQMSPHCPKDECDRLSQNDLIVGCGKPFRFIYGPDETKHHVEVCDYI
jgi:hypothetical protein